MTTINPLNDAAVYQVRAKEAWTGDQWGNEWTLGWTVYPEGEGYALYEDDGRGNGDFVRAYSTLRAAAAAADRHAAAADGETGVNQPFFPENDSPRFNSMLTANGEPSETGYL